ncbi:DUF4926 domain-containing protein [Listeria seeligeri]|uniref:DUF4926 domain-containing protein n=1 Tax=Listeria seeligeri TaxID=1640 RepID=UPI001888D407|nr:DUF4926 domain-containing protein [Listeria seeligeri]MBF2458065.1 DUF4926 domain-containing protein [Listeria seeligeri]MBF2549031.1 DUF4926 domain-containing protein [Listeria seeligeri]MBF2564804.1 DUF4926 domain-containing protein [Listeria seeligeri]
MFKEYDIVYSSVELNEKVPTGTKGVILMMLDSENEIYEVEFVNKNNETIEVTEVKGTQLKK